MTPKLVETGRDAAPTLEVDGLGKLILRWGYGLTLDCGCGRPDILVLRKAASWQVDKRIFENTYKLECDRCGAQLRLYKEDSTVKAKVLSENDYYEEVKLRMLKKHTLEEADSIAKREIESWKARLQIN